MSKKNFLKFCGYTVDELNFKFNNIDKDDGVINLKPIIEKELVKSGEHEYEAMLSFVLKSTKKDPIPFDLKVKIIGHFELLVEESDEDAETILNQKTFAILFPYLRSTITSLTSIGNVQPLIIPIVNLTE